jgi:hypothetical protein
MLDLQPSHAKNFIVGRVLYTSIKRHIPVTDAIDIFLAAMEQCNLPPYLSEACDRLNVRDLHTLLTKQECREIFGGWIKSHPYIRQLPAQLNNLSASPAFFR